MFYRLSFDINYQCSGCHIISALYSEGDAMIMNRRIEIGFFTAVVENLSVFYLHKNSGFRSRMSTKAVACDDSLLVFLVLSLQGNDINQTEFR